MDTINKHIDCEIFEECYYFRYKDRPIIHAFLIRYLYYDIVFRIESFFRSIFWRDIIGEQR